MNQFTPAPRETMEVPMAIYDANGDASNDPALADAVAHALGGTIVAVYGDRPGDDTRGDAGFWISLPTTVAPDSGEEAGPTTPDSILADARWPSGTTLPPQVSEIILG